MIKENQQFFNAVNVVSDACLTLAAFLISAIVRFDVQENVLSSTEFITTPAYVAVFLVYSFAMVAVYGVLQLYRPKRGKQIAQEIGAVLTANAFGVLTLMAFLFLFDLSDYSRLTLFYFYFLSSFLVVTKRIALRMVLRHFRSIGYNLKHVVVIGNGHLALEYVKAVAAQKDAGFVVDGYVSRREKPGLGEQLGAYEETEKILEEHAPDEVVIALEPHESGMMPLIISACEKQGVRTSILPFYNDYLPAHPYVDSIGDCKLMNIRTIPLDNIGNAAMKRTFDIICSLLLIILTSPVMLVEAIGVKLTSPGPILFRQERVGLNKKLFIMLKFRSMRVETSDFGWTTEDDPRKTRFGAFIRKFSLDELPQFFNVLKGDMSLVGPRPEIPHFVNQFKEEVPLYLVRQQVRPGITGWAQVNGYRGDTSIVERVKYDIWYIENWTWLLDLKILAMTVFGGMINQEKTGVVKQDGNEQGIEGRDRT